MSIIIGGDSFNSPIQSFLGCRLWPLQQLLQLLFKNLVGPLLRLNVVFMGLAVSLLLFFILNLHISNFILEFMHLFFKLFSLCFQSADFILHILLFLFCL